MWPDRDKLDRSIEDNSDEVRKLLRDERLEASPETSEFESRRGTRGSRNGEVEVDYLTEVTDYKGARTYTKSITTRAV